MTIITPDNVLSVINQMASKLDNAGSRIETNNRNYAEKFNNIDPTDPNAKDKVRALDIELQNLNRSDLVAIADAKQTLGLAGPFLINNELKRAMASADRAEDNADGLISSSRGMAASAAQQKLSEILKSTPQESSKTLPMANAETKTAEAAAAAVAVHGLDNLPYDKLSAQGPTIDSMTSAAQAQGVSSMPGSNKITGLLNKKMGVATESSATASQIKNATGAQSMNSTHMVSLREVGSHGGASGKTATNLVLYFEVLPEIVEQHVAEYEAIAPAQSPGAFQKYKGTSTTQWTLNAMFVSRTSEEATRNYDNLQKLRGWTKPFYGKRTEASYENKLGAPPPVLMMSGLRNLIGPVPVVITSLNWNWPKDVDYIATTIQSDVDGNYIPFPTILSVPIQLVESYSVDQFNNFSLADYRQGRLYHAFNQGELEVPETMKVRGTGDA